MKLLERIARGWSNYDSAFPFHHQIKSELEAGLKRSFAVDCTNIWKWCQNLQTKTKHLTEIIPLCRLPFAEMWMEFIGHDGIEFGCLAVEDVKQSRIVFNLYNCADKHAVYMGPSQINYDENSNPVDFGVSIPPAMEMNKESFSTMIRSICFTYLYTISFFHCKNVETSPVIRSPELQHAINKKSIFHVPTFHIIEVHKYMERHYTESNENKNSGTVAAHLVRGHFKRYTEEAPLMGKHSGVYFWSQHVSGQGPIKINDYRVHPPTGRHIKKCIIQ